MNFSDLSRRIAQKLRKIPPTWNSQSAVLELSNACYSKWEQSEWLDFYFRYLCEKHLPHVIPMNEKVCGTTFFDGIFDFSPSFKPDNHQDIEIQEKEGSGVSSANREFSLAYSNYQHWRQMEWIESYFNYLCERRLSRFLKIPGPAYNRMAFDAIMEIPWIFKIDIQNIGNPNIILEDADLILRGLSDFQQIGIILARGFAEYYRGKMPEEKDNSRVSSMYQEKPRMNKKLRLHSIFHLRKIDFIPFSFDSLEKCETFQPGKMEVREKLREKILLNIPDIQRKSQYTIHLDHKQKIDI